MHLLYARVSTDKQAEDGAESLPDQLRRCRAVAQMRGVSVTNIAEYIDKGISGSTRLDTRPRGHELMLAVREGDTVVASKLDRMFRSASDALNTIELFTKMGVQLIIIDHGIEPVTSNGTAKLFFGLLSLVAEFERSLILQRTADGRRAKLARRGYMGGRLPYGLCAVGKGREAVIEQDAQEQETIAAIVQLRDDGHKSGRIARYLTAHYPSRTGKPWQQIEVDRILKRISNG